MLVKVFILTGYLTGYYEGNMGKNERDHETLRKIALAFGSNDDPNYNAARHAMNEFLKSFDGNYPSWFVTRQTVLNWFKVDPPSFTARNNEFIKHFLYFLKDKTGVAFSSEVVLPQHYASVVGRLIVLFEKKLKSGTATEVDSSFPIYPDASGTVKIYQNRIPHIDKESLKFGLVGKFVTFRRPIGPSVGDEVSIEYVETTFINGNFFVTWHVKIDGVYDTFKGSVILTGNGLWFYMFNASKGGRFRILQSEANFWRNAEGKYVDAMLLSESPSFEDQSGAARTTLLIRLPKSEDDTFETRVQKNTGRRSLEKINETFYKKLVTEHLFQQNSAIDNLQARLTARTDISNE